MGSKNSLKKAREICQSGKHGIRRANDNIAFEKNRAHQTTRRKATAELRNIEDGNHTVVEKVNSWNIY